MYLSNIQILSHKDMRPSFFGMTRMWVIGTPSDRENYFRHAGQNFQQAFSALLDILNHCQTFFPVDDWQISVVILVFLI